MQAAGQDHDEALADAMMVKVQDINLNQLDLNGSIFKAQERLEKVNNVLQKLKEKKIQADKRKA